MFYTNGLLFNINEVQFNTNGSLFNTNCTYLMLRFVAMK